MIWFGRWVKLGSRAQLKAINYFSRSCSDSIDVVGVADDSPQLLIFHPLSLVILSFCSPRIASEY